MSDLNEALMEYDNKNYEKAYYLFREYRKKWKIRKSLTDIIHINFLKLYLKQN